MNRRIAIPARGCAVPTTLLLCAVLTACAEPSADTGIATAMNAAHPTEPQIQGASGPLSTEQSRALLQMISQTGDSGSQMLQRHLAIERAVAGTALTADNKVTVLPDGVTTFHAMAAAIRGAKRTLDLEYYTIEDVDLDGDGKKLSDLLVAKRQQGVEINIMYDSYGSSDTPNAFFDKLKAAGVKLLDFHPISPVHPIEAINLNDRDHRKILVADGEIGIVGGVNLSKSYESKLPGSDSGSKSKAMPQAQPAPAQPQAQNKGGGGIATALGLATNLPSQWRDTDAEIEGPAVAELQVLFVDHWRREKGPAIATADLFPKLTAKGDQVARIIGSTPDQKISRYYVTVVSALRNAQSKAWISAAYFVPTHDEMEALTQAARRGVDVRLLVPAESDSKQAIEAAQSHYSDLLDAGVKIYEAQGVVLHSKTVTIDGVWSAIGSSNFDHRSVLYNDEVDAIVLGAPTARALEQVFEDGIKISKPIDRGTWEASRPVTERIRGFLARLWGDLL